MAQRRALITQSTMAMFAGSETLAFELAAGLAARDWDVTIATHYFNLAWPEACEQVDGLTIVPLSDPAVGELCRDPRLSLAWIQHHVVPKQLLEDPRDVRIAFNHMSAFHPIEFPIRADTEQKLAAASVFTALETQEVQVATGLILTPPDAHFVWGNPAPDAYVREPVETKRGGVLAIVSNHLTPEVLEAGRMLGAHWEVRLVGVQRELGAHPLRMTADFIHGCDAIVTIGKTVQYSLVAGVPVYVYDHFGGPGWLDDSNLETARHYNYSGRGFGTKSAQQIATEIFEGFDSASQFIRERHEESLERHALGGRIEALDEFLCQRNFVPTALSPNAHAEHLNVQEALALFLVDAVKRRYNLESAEAQLLIERAELATARAKIEKLESASIRRLVRNARRVARILISAAARIFRS